MGFLDYYRQFDEMSPEEVSAQLRAKRDAERARAVSEVPLLDLSSAAWPGPPHPDAVNAATFALRRALNTYPDDAPLRTAIAARHGVHADRVVAGAGAGELLRAALATIARGGEVAVAWPGWGPLPRLVHEAGGRPVPVPLTGEYDGATAVDRPLGGGVVTGGGAADPDALLAAIGAGTRAVALCTPNDPTGAAVEDGALARLARELPERVWLLVDAALAPFAPGDPTVLADARERVLVVHSASKAHALAGLRAGYAVGPAGPLLEGLAPVDGLAAPAQAALTWAVEHGDAAVARRRAQAAAERERLAAALAGTPFSFPAGHGHLVWLRSSAHDGRTIAGHLAARRIAVLAGAAWGDEAHVRIALRDAAATERLVAALGELAW